jgi:succinate dehydrogenase membrane anchor subunit
MAGPDKTPPAAILRSQLGRARGLGSAHAGSAHWWAQRMTALALVPLSLWFIASMISLEGAGQAEVAIWLHGTFALVLVLCLIGASFWHMALGLCVVIEDYVHREAARLTLVLAVRAASILLALFCIVAVLRLGL